MARSFCRAFWRTLAITGGAIHQSQYARRPIRASTLDCCAGLKTSIRVQMNVAAQAASKPR